MANRYMNQFRYSFERAVVEIFLKATFGASGAVTLDSSLSKGVASITKEAGAGQYTILLQDTYAKLLGVDRTMVEADDPAAPIMHVTAEDVASAKTIGLQMLGPDGTTATNPADGEIMLVRIALKNSSI